MLGPRTDVAARSGGAFRPYGSVFICVWGAVHRIVAVTVVPRPRVSVEPLQRRVAEEETSVRDSYHEELDDINACLVAMANSVGSAMSTATTALLDADVALADLVIAGDAQIDAARDGIEQRCFTLLARQQPVAGDLRTITTSMRIISDLERMGDLAEHIAKIARMRFPDHAVPQEVRPAFLEAGHVAELLITKAATVIAKRDLQAAAELETDDDAMDRLHRGLFRQLLSDDWPYGIESAIDVTLLGRYYERFADHAVSVARRVAYLVTGERHVKEEAQA
jgi:phosphate transport system protein